MQSYLAGHDLYIHKLQPVLNLHLYLDHQVFHGKEEQMWKMRGGEGLEQR